MVGPLSDSVPTVGVLPEVTIIVGDTVGASEGLQMSSIVHFSSAPRKPLSTSASQHSFEVSNMSIIPTAYVNSLEHPVKPSIMSS